MNNKKILALEIYRDFLRKYKKDLIWWGSFQKELKSIEEIVSFVKEE